MNNSITCNIILKHIFFSIFCIYNNKVGLLRNTHKFFKYSKLRYSWLNNRWLLHLFLHTLRYMNHSIIKKLSEVINFFIHRDKLYTVYLFLILNMLLWWKIDSPISSSISGIYFALSDAIMIKINMIFIL